MIEIFNETINKLENDSNHISFENGQARLFFRLLVLFVRVFIYFVERYNEKETGT
jgi:hypothetical protein